MRHRRRVSSLAAGACGGRRGDLLVVGGWRAVSVRRRRRRYPLRALGTRLAGSPTAAAAALLAWDTGLLGLLAGSVDRSPPRSLRVPGRGWRRGARGRCRAGAFADDPIAVAVAGAGDRLGREAIARTLTSLLTRDTGLLGVLARSVDGGVRGRGWRRGAGGLCRARCASHTTPSPSPSRGAGD